MARVKNEYYSNNLFNLEAVTALLNYFQYLTKLSSSLFLRSYEKNRSIPIFHLSYPCNSIVCNGNGYLL